jgi:chromosome segregation ATPase
MPTKADLQKQIEALQDALDDALKELAMANEEVRGAQDSQQLAWGQYYNMNSRVEWLQAHADMLAQARTVTIVNNNAQEGTA